MPAQGFEPWTIGLKVDVQMVRDVLWRSVQVRSEYDCHEHPSVEIRHVSPKAAALAAVIAAPCFSGLLLRRQCILYSIHRRSASNAPHRKLTPMVRS